MLPKADNGKTVFCAESAIYIVSYRHAATCRQLPALAHEPAERVTKRMPGSVLSTPPAAKPPFSVPRRCKAAIDLAAGSLRLRPMLALRLAGRKNSAFRGWRCNIMGNPPALPGDFPLFSPMSCARSKRMSSLFPASVSSGMRLASSRKYCCGSSRHARA